MEIIKLQVNGMVNPVGIDDKHPKFSFVVEGENFYQKSYRIIVSDIEKALENNEGNMWDSGEVNSDECLNIEYKGKELTSCQEYYYKVIVNGEIEKTAMFTTAFMDAENQFKAYWIGQPLGFGGSAENIRWDFYIDRPVKRSYLYIAALGTARIYLNGEVLSDDYFDGAISVYQKSIAYRTHKLNLRQGKNCLCIRLGYGFYGAKKLYAAMFVDFQDGTASCGLTSPGRNWVVKRGAITMHGVFDGETYDANMEEDWLNPDYNVTFGNWVASFNMDPPRGSFRANTVPPMRKVKVFEPKSITETKEGILVDAGVNVCGFLTIKMKGSKNAKVTVTHSERLCMDGKLDRANLRSAECTDNYILCGKGEETYSPLFTYHGFQYALIQTEGNVDIKDIKVNYLRSDVDLIGKFTCDNKIFNQLHEIALQTEGNNLNGTFTDCPQRDERSGWLNDLTSRLYGTVCNYSMRNYLPNFIKMQSETVDIYGTLTDTVPFTIGGVVADPISAYTVLGKMVLDHFGDTTTIKENYPYFKKWIDFIKNDADNNGGVVARSCYGDWCPAKIFAKPDNAYTFSKFVEPAFVSAIYFLWYLRHMEQMAVSIGKTDDEKEFKRQFAEYKQHFDNKYYNKQTGLYGNGSQTECAIAMTVFDYDEELCAKLAKHINDDVIAHGYHMTCGNQGYRHLIYNLCEYGYAETVSKLLLNKKYPGWRYMLECGATSVWERWESEGAFEMQSFNHPMFCAYEGFFYNYILGIRMGKCTNAFKNIVIEPCFISSVGKASGEYETVRGKITVDWIKDGEGVNVKIKTPANTNLTFNAKGKTIIYNGNKYVDSISLSNGTFELTVVE